jgi:hypothetical protein
MVDSGHAILDLTIYSIKFISLPELGGSALALLIAIYFVLAGFAQSRRIEPEAAKKTTRRPWRSVATQDRRAVKRGS